MNEPFFSFVTENIKPLGPREADARSWEDSGGNAVKNNHVAVVR